MRVESVVSERTREDDQPPQNNTEDGMQRGSPISAPRSSPTEENSGEEQTTFNPDVLQQAEALKR